MKKVLVTGCTGVVGHGICLHFLNEGWEVWGTSRNALISNHPAFTPLQLDLKEQVSIRNLEPILKEVDAVVHNAAKIPSGETPSPSVDEAFYAINFEGTKTLLACAAQAGLPHLVFISASPFGMLAEASPMSEETPFLPRNSYAASKAAAEMVCREYDIQNKLPITVLRFSAPYGYVGRRQAVLPRFVDSVLAGETITLWGTGARQQIFTFAEDIGRACALAIETQKRDVFHVAGPEVVTMRQLAETIIGQYPDTGGSIEYADKPDPQEGKRVSISLDKIKAELGFVPAYTLQEGLSKIANATEEIHFYEKEDA